MIEIWAFMSYVYLREISYRHTLSNGESFKLVVKYDRKMPRINLNNASLNNVDPIWDYVSCATRPYG